MLMKFILSPFLMLGAALIVATLANPSLGASPLSSQPTGQPSKLFYFEIQPAKQLKLEFSAARACQDPVRMDRFESTQDHVRVIHLYAHASPACAHAPSGLSEVALNLGKDSKDPKVLTRVYLTADSELSLRTR